MINKKDLIDVIEFEILKIKFNIKKSGITKWALIGSLMTILFLISQEVESHNVVWSNIYIVILGVYLFYEILNLFDFSIIQSDKTYNKLVRFKPSDKVFGQSRKGILYELIIVIFLLWIISTIDIQIYKIFIVFIFGFFLIKGLLALLALTFSFMKIPYPLTAKMPKVGKFIAYSTLVIIISGTIGYLYQSQLLNLTIFEYRLGVYIFSIIILLSKLISVDEYTPLLHTLEELRRKLGMGKIDVQNGIEEFEIILDGLKISDIFHQDISAIFEYFKKISKIRNTINIDFNNLQKLISTNDFKKNKKSHDELLYQYELIQQNVDEIEKLFNKSSEILSTINKNMRYVEILSPESLPEILKISNRLLELYKDYDKKSKQEMASIVSAQKKTFKMIEKFFDLQ